MARAIRTEILIQAPAEAVRAVLTDFGAHVGWVLARTERDFGALNAALRVRVERDG